MQQFDQAPVPDDIQAQVGTLSNLITTEKSNLVGAVNEVKSTLSDLFPFAKGVASDCNALTSEGAWRTNANTLNMPNNKTGFIQVWKRISEDTIYQRFYTTDGYVYWRYTTNGSFANISWKEELNEQMTYQQGTSYSIEFDGFGIVTNASKTIQISIPVPKILTRNPTAITKMSFTCRGVDGYVDVFSSYTDTIGLSGYTTSISKRNDCVLRVGVDKTTALTNVTNNTPCQAQGTVIFTA